MSVFHSAVSVCRVQCELLCYVFVSAYRLLFGCFAAVLIV